MAVVKNNTENVSAAKGVKDGYFFSAPKGTAVPTDYSTPLDPAFVNLGYVSEDGFVFTEDKDSNEVPDINGDIVAELDGTRSETVQVTLLETKADTLKEVRGHNNVSDDKGVMTIKHNSDTREERVYVAELLLKNGRKQRIVIPNGKVSEIGDVTYKSGDALVYEITIKCFIDENGDTVVEYIESNETEKAMLSAVDEKVAVKTTK